MPDSDQTIRALQEALRASPGNVPLRQHLADLLLSAGRAAEAEQEYRQALAAMPANAALQLGLACAFYLQQKDSHALVIVEDLLAKPGPPAQAHVLHARLLLRAGEAARAVQAYRQAVEQDPSVADPDLAAMLGLGLGADAGTSRVVEGKVRAAWEDPDDPAEPAAERPAITFADVGGMDALKDEIRMKIIHPLKHPELFRAYGKSVGGGLLMYGPPGCGKTHLARATAGQIEATFFAVGIHEVLDMWIGSSERNLHEIFERARLQKPCVLFFDEVDALGASRSDMRHSAGRHFINQFLAEMDGAQASNDGVLILAATNAPWHLDAAFRRPGRFDRVLFVPPPDAEARAAILRLHCAGKPVADLDHAAVAKRTDGFSGADLKALVDAAVDRKLAEALKAGRQQPLGTRDLLQAAAAVKPSTKEWFATARNHALYANHGGLYDDILKYLQR